MEGLLDFMLRDVLKRVGGIDRCVSEFIRVTGTLLPERVFTRIVPELNTFGRTRAGVPVRAQLLGSDAVCLADNAARLAGLGPAGIDLNFGCPAKLVNRHGGGAALLDDPELVGRIVGEVRRAVPHGVPVSAKMRLGFNDSSRALECALAIVAGGAFVAVERRAKQPMLPLGFFALPGFSAAVAFGIAVNLSYYGVLFVLSLYLQRVMGYAPLAAGLAYLPLTGMFIVSNVIQTRSVSRCRCTASKSDGVA